MASNPVSDKNREIYDHADDEIWKRAVYQPVHGGLHFANIGGRKFLDFIGSYASLGEQSQVLDLCCGSGAADCYLAERFGSFVTGIDINESQIDRARTRARSTDRLRFVLADASVWNPDRLYDLVFSLDSLTLVADLPTLLKTCRSALRPGGVLAIADVVEGKDLSEEMRAFALSEDGAVALIGPTELGAAIERAGFRNVAVDDLREEAVRAFTLIHQSVHESAGWQDVPLQKIEEWRLLSERYLKAFAAGELGYARIVATAA